MPRRKKISPFQAKSVPNNVSSESFAPITNDSKEMFISYLVWNEKYLICARKVKNANEEYYNAKSYINRLYNIGVDPESDIFAPLKTDEGLIKYYLDVMKSYLLEISIKIENLYSIFFSRSEEEPDMFKDTEKSITRLFDVVLQAESRCIKLCEDFVRRCLNEINKVSEMDSSSKYI